ncbi:MAG: UDP-N-acetylmuramoyl-tripeptide--D-alanyl-D-alanine ligase [Clostridia bacterium]|nr:UDP-N-acetylmuramoyl-tripeptide--D-alanyl-D-alanine ligase [Clostridia bacterium]
MLLSLLAFLFFGVIGMTFAGVVGENFSPYTGFVAYLFFVFVYIDTEKHVNAKLPLKKTKRLVRLSIVFILLLLAVGFGVAWFFDFIVLSVQGKAGEVLAVLKYMPVALTPLLSPYVLWVANAVLSPFEKANNNRYVKITKKTLDASRVLKIGITGSYGKTSVKEILREILSVRFRVLSTPASYNTPLGIAYSVKPLDSTYDVFIAEMGAREEGDIAELARLVNPDFAVLTGINSQHLETFGSDERIKNAKFELFANLKRTGKGFFNVDSDGGKELYERFDGEKYFVGEGGLASARDVVSSAEGLTFSLCIADETPVKCSTTLIGRHSVANILLASAVAYKTGMTPKEIAVGINRLRSVKHRLEVVPNDKGITVIDDSYNANSDGADCALETLSLFKGRKIIVTPGLVELGTNGNKLHYELGKKISKVADVLIISARHNAEMLFKGYVDGGGERENVYCTKNRLLAKETLDKIIKTGDVVLFENDLPDIYD